GLAALVVLLGGEKTTLARWSLATLLCLASLAANPAGGALPGVAGVLASFPFAWKPARIARELGPWLLIGALWVFITSNAQWAAELAKNLVPIWTRPFVAADALAFYLAKVVWPAGLSADYGRAPDIAYASGWLWWSWIGPVALASILAAVKPLRIYLVPLGIFAAALLPTLGLVPFNFQVVSTVADRYAYFAMLGPALALGMMVARSKHAWVPSAGAVVVIALGALTVIRLPLWSEDLKLFAATLATNPDSWKAKHNYASALDDRGRTTEGETLMREVIARRPDSAEAYTDIGVMLWKLGRREEAAQATQRALELRPTPGAAKNLATMQAELGNQAGQIDALRRALEMDPDDLLRTQQLAWGSFHVAGRAIAQRRRSPRACPKSDQWRRGHSAGGDRSRRSPGRDRTIREREKHCARLGAATRVGRRSARRNGQTRCACAGPVRPADPRHGKAVTRLYSVRALP
ncbi:MAG: tetratricopeptide repeat protein, partial [Chthoniobacterales bacterium]